MLENIVFYAYLVKIKKVMFEFNFLISDGENNSKNFFCWTIFTMYNVFYGAIERKSFKKQLEK
jgi:hypothetical protein